LYEKYDIITCAGSGHHLRPDRIDKIVKEMPGSLASGTLCSITLRFLYSAAIISDRIEKKRAVPPDCELKKSIYCKTTKTKL
jgi:hypothetical protein